MTLSAAAGEERMWPVRVEPLGVDVDVRATQSLLAAARAARLRWPAACGGVGVCTQCVVRVVEGAANAPPPGAYEAERLATRRARPGERLACHLKVTGPVRVTKVGVRRR